MPIQVGDKIIRNIQEQVGKNQADINALKLAQALGFKNIGTLDEASDIPEGTYNYGEFFFIGTEAPYEVYIYTNHDGTDEFINLGTLAGPQGDIGVPGSTGTIEVVATVTGEAGSNASVVNTGTAQAAKLRFIIPTGAVGPQGPVGSKGEKGDQGIQGIQGIQGDPGESFMIVGTVTSESQLPDPSETPRNYAYIYNDGDASTPNRLYYIEGTEGNEAWSYSSFAAAGTTVLVNGNPVYSWNADSKLDKETGTSTYDQVYGKTSAGAQTMYNIRETATANTIPSRGSAGQLDVPTVPINDNDAASKVYVDVIAGGKLSKDDTVTTTAKIYVKEADGSQSMQNISASVTSQAVPIRDAVGNIQVTGVPINDNDAVPKIYVDGRSIDYIVEQGTSGIWGYRKWNSGVAECWTKEPITKSMTPNSAWGSLFNTGSDAIGAQAFPFTFISAPTECAKMTCGQGGWQNWENTPTTTTSGSYQWIRPTSGGTAQAKLFLYEIGYWK